MDKSRIRHPARALLLVGSLFAAQASLAQVSTGGLSGKLAPTDTVTLRNVDTNARREVKVKSDGTFWARRMPVGKYEITIRHQDGSEEKVIATVSLGVTTPINPQ